MIYLFCTLLLFTVVGGHKHFAAVGICRALLEAAVQNYITDHGHYVNHTKNHKCAFLMTSKTTVTDALEHMLGCPGQLNTWKYFQKNAKLFTSAPGKSVYKGLSEHIHFEMHPSENIANVPDWMEPISKRFLIRLLKIQNYEVNIITTGGYTRPPVPREIETSPETSPVASPVVDRKRKSSEEISDTATSSAPKIKRRKERKKNK